MRLRITHAHALLRHPSAVVMCLLLAALWLGPAFAQEAQPAAPAAQPDAEVLADRAGYAVGVTIGRSILARIDSAPIPLRREALLEGIHDAVTGGTLRLSEREMQAAMSAMGQAAAPDQSGRAAAEREALERARPFIERARQRDREMAGQLEREQALRGELPGRRPTPAERIAADTATGEALRAEVDAQARAVTGDREAAEDGRLFLLSNSQRPGVVSRPSGLQYRVVAAGAGPSPAPTDRITAHYVGKRIDGAVFESSRDSGQPLTFTLDQVIDGWAEALPLMKQGARWELYLPASLAFGERGRGEKVKPGEAVVFEIEIVKIEPAPTPQPAAEAPAGGDDATTKAAPAPSDAP